MIEAPERPHPLDPCDPDECYRTMMSERTTLITARREAEDNLVKTIIQLSTALLALLAGFISQAKLELDLPAFVIFISALIALAASIIAGLMEHRFSSRAYEQQQNLVEEYFQRRIFEFGEPAANKTVRRAQAAAFVLFVTALGLLAIFAIIEAGENYGKSREHSASTSASASAAASTSASAASTAAAAPSAASPSAVGGNEVGADRKIGRANNAASAAAKDEVKR